MCSKRGGGVVKGVMKSAQEIHAGRTNSNQATEEEEHEGKENCRFEEKKSVNKKVCFNFIRSLSAEKCWSRTNVYICALPKIFSKAISFRWRSAAELLRCASWQRLQCFVARLLPFLLYLFYSLDCQTQICFAWCACVLLFLHCFEEFSLICKYSPRQCYSLLHSEKWSCC